MNTEETDQYIVSLCFTLSFRAQARNPSGARKSDKLLDFARKTLFYDRFRWDSSSYIGTEGMSKARKRSKAL